MADEHTLNQALMIGADNKAWVPVAYIGTDPEGKAKERYIYENLDSTDFTMNLVLPLPSVKGPLKLYIDGLRVALSAADADDYVTQVAVFGNTSTTTDTVYSDGTNRTSPGIYTYEFTAVDCSSYGFIHAFLNIVATTTMQLCVRYVQLRCYYAP